MTPPDLPTAGVVIAAAGAGTRLGGAKKQFRLLGGKPLLVQTALRFESHPRVDAICVAVPAPEVDEITRMCRNYDLSKVVSIVAGGATRQESVRIALAALPISSRTVLTHDAVRPFVSSDDIDELLAALIDHEAAVLAVPVTDTMCRTRDGLVSERVEREGVFRLLTPQGFRREVLERGHRKAIAESQVFTDEVTLVKSLGIDVKVVSCTSPNVKITTPADWAQALWMWPAWMRAHE